MTQTEILGVATLALKRVNTLKKQVDSLEIPSLPDLQAEVEKLTLFLQEEIAKIPIPKDGVDGIDGKDFDVKLWNDVKADIEATIQEIQSKAEAQGRFNKEATSGFLKESKAILEKAVEATQKKTLDWLEENKELLKGERGERGIAGRDGESIKGDKGEKGDKGDRGQDG